MFLFFTNIHLALALVCWNLVYLIRNNIKPEVYYLAFLFSGLFFIYNLDRLKGNVDADAVNTPLRTSFLRTNRRTIVSLIIFFCIAFLYLLSRMQFSIYIYLLFPCISTFFYWIQNKVFYIVPKVSSILKPVLLGVSWGYTMSVLPVLYWNIPDQNFKFHFISTALILFTNGLYYDARDRVGDQLFSKANVFFVYPIYSLKFFLIIPPFIGVILNVYINHYRVEFFTNLYYFILGVLSYKYWISQPLKEKTLDYWIDLPILLFPLIEIFLFF